METNVPTLWSHLDVNGVTSLKMKLVTLHVSCMSDVIVSAQAFHT